MATPKLRKEKLVDQFSPQARATIFVVFIFAMIWSFGYPAYMRYPDIDIDNFYPIFQVLNSWYGFIYFIGYAVGSDKFKGIILCRRNRVSSKTYSMKTSLYSFPKLFALL
jgi:hypothetical protein